MPALRRWSIRFFVGLLMLGALFAAVEADNATRKRTESEYESRLKRGLKVWGDELQNQIIQNQRNVLFLSRALAKERGGATTFKAEHEGSARHVSSGLKVPVLDAFVEANPSVLGVELTALPIASEGSVFRRDEPRQDGVVLGPYPPSLELQNFARLALQPGQVYVADFTLAQDQYNRHAAALPVLRMATPVFSADGTQKSMLVVSFDASSIIPSFNQQLPPGFEPYLINGAGDFIQHPDPEESFGFSLGKRHRWSEQFTELKPENARPSEPVLSQVTRLANQEMLRVAQRRILLDSRDPARDLTFVLAVPDRFITVQMQPARRLASIAVLAGLVIAAILFFLYRAKTGHQIRASLEQSRLATIVRNSSDAIIGTTPDGVVTSWNAAAERMFGYREMEVQGQRVVDLIIPAGLETEEWFILSRVVRGEIVPQFNTRRRHRDGQLLEVSVVVSPIKGSKGEIIGAAKTIRDNSEAKAAEAKILALNATLEQQVVHRTEQIRTYSILQQAILDHAGYAIIASNTAGVVTLFNPAAEKMLGYQASDVVGQLTPASWHDGAEVLARAIALASELGAPVPADFNAYVSLSHQQKPQLKEWTYIRRDGTRLPCLLGISALRDEHGHIFGNLCIAMDLTQRKQDERERLRLLEILELSPDYIGMSDMQGNLKYHNRAARLTVGMRDDADLSAMHISDMHPPWAGHKVLEQALPEVLRLGVWRGETALLHRLGHEIPVSQVLILHRDADGKPELLSTIMRDISEQRGREQDLALAREHAEEATRAKSLFLANMSHEIRTPINAIMGLLQLLHRSDPDARQRDYLAKAEGAARLLLANLSDVLDFSKIEAGRLSLDIQTFEIESLLQMVSIIVGPALARKPVVLLIDIDPALPRYLRGDALRLQQVLINLVSNAIKFTERGEVVIFARLDERAADMLQVNFGVRDSGMGILPEQCRYIFDAFSQAETSTSRRFGGTGLGLSISQRLVQLMNTSLQVSSESGHGSLFQFTVQLEPDASQVDVAGMPCPEPGLSVCLIHDNRSARRIACTLLQELGACAEMTGSIQDLLLNPQAAPCKHILLDWGQLEQNGWESCDQLQSRFGTSVRLLIMAPHHQRASVEGQLALRGWTGAEVIDAPLTRSKLAAALSQTPQARRELPGQTRPSNRRLKGLKVLLIEDNPLNQQVACELLGNEGANVTVAASGAEGIAAFQAELPPFDIVITDIHMPGLDGFATARAIRALSKSSLPIIAMSADVSKNAELACIEAGMVAHVGKPFDLNELVLLVLKHVATGGSGENKVGPPARCCEWIDAEPALKAFGKQEVYLRILHRFVQDAGAMSRRFEALLKAGEYDAIAEVLHSLKGIAAVIGAVRLVQVIADIEESGPLGAGTTQLQALAVIIAATLQAATELGSYFDAPALVQKVTEVAPVRQELDRLCALLRHADVGAVAVLDELLQRDLPCGSSSLDNLALAMKRLDFPAATLWCQSILDTLEE